MKNYKDTTEGTQEEQRIHRKANLKKEEEELVAYDSSDQEMYLSDSEDEVLKLEN